MRKRRESLRTDRFTHEQLEDRQMMAADTLESTLSASLIEASGSATTAAVASTTAGATANTSLAALAAVLTRSYDGSGNNLTNVDWGSAGEQLTRIAEAAYADGLSAMAGADRASAREISNALAAQDPENDGNERGLSAFVYLWGQFLDHDIDLTKSGTTERVPITVPTGDPEFDPESTGSKTISFRRSEFDAATGVTTAREQTNSITAWIDGSQVYGSDQATADSLRTFVGGKLITSAGNLPALVNGSFVAGDERANENIELTAMHALFVREHNRLATTIAAQNPRLTDEQIYQRARAMVIAELQAITFNEFLPALLGANAIRRYAGYNAAVNPAIANEFSTAGFRLGHSLVNDDVEFFGNDGRAVRDEVELRDAFFNPALLQETGIDSLLKYVASSQAKEIDNQIVDSLRNFLFIGPGQGGFDLASLNIQRGRDHGLADYNTTREAYGLARVTSFAEITDNVAVHEVLASVYSSVDDIDLWVGALAEDHVAGSSVGELTRTIIAEQFTRLRDGDRFWYQNVYRGRELAQIERTTLAQVLQRNTTNTNLQANVFFMNATVGGRVVVEATGPRAARTPQGLAGASVELLNDAGEVIDSATTDRQGRYQFRTFRETGDYQIRITTLNRAGAVVQQTLDVLISRGGMQRDNLDFRLRAGSRAAPTGAAPTGATASVDPAAALDAAFSMLGSPSTTLRRNAVS